MYVNQIYGKYATTELTTGRLREIDTYRQKNIHTGIVSNYQLNDSILCIGDRTISEYGEENLNFLLAPLFKNINRFKFPSIDNKYELLNVFNNVTLRDNDLNYHKEFLLLINIKNNEYQLYYD
jgi:hypothetical protein